MKKVFSILCIMIMLVSCKKEAPRTSYVIKGSANNVYNGVRAYLNKMGPRGRLTPVDTAIVMNQAFTFEGKVDTPELLYLTVNSVNGRIPVMVENSEMTLTLDKANIKNTKIKGSTTQDLYDSYDYNFKQLQDAYSSLNQAYRLASKNNDSLSKATKYKELMEKRKEITEYPLNFIVAHPNSFVSLEIFKTQLKSKNKDTETLVQIFDNFDEAIKNSKTGRALATQINMMRQQINANKQTKINTTAPNFTGPTPEGKEIALTDITKNAKVTIIDFWAAWCGPCRRENPNVVNIYNKYHDKGLDIIGISLDGDNGRRQKNPKQAWVDAIKKDNLPWHQISHLKGFQDPIAKQYNIRSIPATYILDSKGKIVAKNLRGAQLENKIKELLES